ncbi:MAG: TIGR01777 family oxidoreductase [Actinomycetales bacterium]|nr:TIGR01777 family oxidoreductase [Actinomycetales bacterium]
MRVLISGASGLIGTELSARLKNQGHDVVHLVRREALNDSEISWAPGLKPLELGVIDGFDAVVNLAGATTGKLPWTKKYMRELISSRIDSTNTLVEAMQRATKKPKVFVSGSASGFYGDTGTKTAVETDPKGTGFLSDLAAEWEAAALRAPNEVRVVLVRTTMVLSRKLGALGRLIPLVKAGIGGPLASGNQWWDWISLPDEARAIIHLINTEDASGAYNLTAPQSATCRELVQALAKAFNRPAFLPVPAFALRLAFGLGADELLICNQKLSAEKLLATGFEFEHPTLEQAMAWVAGK